MKWISSSRFIIRISLFSITHDSPGLTSPSGCCSNDELLLENNCVLRHRNDLNDSRDFNEEKVTKENHLLSSFDGFLTTSKLIYSIWFCIGEKTNYRLQNRQFISSFTFWNYKSKLKVISFLLKVFFAYFWLTE